VGSPSFPLGAELRSRPPGQESSHEHVRKALTAFEMLRVPRDMELARGMAVEPVVMSENSAGSLTVPHSR